MNSGDKLIAVIVGGAVIYMIIASTRFPMASPGPVGDGDDVMRYADLMLRYGKEQGVDPALVAAVVFVESSGRPGVIGSSGEVGLMQILPTTAKWIYNISAEQLLQPAKNIQAGTAYLRYCVDRKAGNVLAGLAGLER